MISRIICWRGTEYSLSRATLQGAVSPNDVILALARASQAVKVASAMQAWMVWVGNLRTSKGSVVRAY